MATTKNCLKLNIACKIVLELWRVEFEFQNVLKLLFIHTRRMLHTN